MSAMCLILQRSSEKTYTYPEALALVRNVFTGLDPEFASILDSYINNKQIDAFPQKHFLPGFLF